MEEGDGEVIRDAVEMSSVRTIDCKLAIVTGIAGIAFATISGQVGVPMLTIGIGLIGAGVVVWRGGEIWILLATWAIAVAWYFLPVGLLAVEYFRAGVPIPLNLDVVAWSVRLVLSLIGLTLAIIAQRKL